MTTTQMNNLIESYDRLSIDDKEYLSDLLQKNLAESKRKTLVDRVKEAEANYSAGKVKKGGLKDLYEDLEND
jgi:flagellar motor switch protein FliG